MKKSLLITLTSSFVFIGCAGFDFPPSIFEFKPFSLLEGAQIGRDKVANRNLVAEHRIKIDGRSSNEVLTMLGQPQMIEIRDKRISQDWYFSYYPRLAKAPNTDQQTFVVRMYHNKVIDVVNLNV